MECVKQWFRLQEGRTGRGTASRLVISHLTSGVEVVSFMVLGCCFTSVQVAGGSDTAVAACGVKTMWAASSVSSVGVVDCCHADASSTAGVEGMCAAPAQGRCTALLTSVCSAVLLVLSIIMTSMSELSNLSDDMAYAKW